MTGYGDMKLGKTSLTGIEIKNVGADFAVLSGVSASPERGAQPPRISLLCITITHIPLIWAALTHFHSRVWPGQISVFLAGWDGLTRHGSYEKWPRLTSRSTTMTARVETEEVTSASRLLRRCTTLRFVVLPRCFPPCSLSRT